MTKVMDKKILNLIDRRQRQILVHSYIYYELDENIIDDSTWSKWALELEELLRKYPEESAASVYAKDFENFDHSTGAGLNYFKPEIIGVARMLLRYKKENVK